jgi:gamma-glutamyltranspeptidase/glutathione hydrolase
MDAAIAASAVLCVTEPYSTGIGGDCFLLYHDAVTNTLHGLNGSGRAPLKANVEEFKRRGYNTIPEVGVLTVTVPGAVDAWYTALERFGRMGLGEVLQAAIQYAERGFAVTEVVATMWEQSEPLLASSEEARNTYLCNGQAPRAGVRHHQPNLARSLRLIADQGPDAFYRGEIAEEIVRFINKNNGLLQLEDLAMHTSEWVEPIHTDYRGVQVYELPPNGQGITALMALNILENADLSEMEHLSAEHIHTFSEALKLAMCERDRFVSDPEFNTVPVADLLAKDFAQRQWSRITPDRAFKSPISSGLPHHRDTIYLSVVDAERNAVSFINSLFYPWGSGMVAGESGVLLQNRGAGFVLDVRHRNGIAPRKRPLHTIIPAMVYGDDKPILSFGVMGGHYQPMGHCYVLSNWLDFGFDVQEAIDAARFFPEGDVLAVERGVRERTRRDLARRGHRVVETQTPMGGGQGIVIDWKNGVLLAGSDARKDGCALGY